MPDVFDSFSNPERKKLKEDKQKRKKDEDCREFMELGKLYCRNLFNEKELSPENVADWSPQMDWDLWTEADLSKWATLFHTITTKDVGFVEPQKKPKGLDCVLHYISAAEFCMAFLDKKQTLLGWKTNVTGYNPVCVSSSSNELVVSTTECYRMMIKQALRLVSQVKGWSLPDLKEDPPDLPTKKKLKEADPDQPDKKKRKTTVNKK
jgi:hypothetical protein